MNRSTPRTGRHEDVAATPSRRASVTVDVHVDPWLRDVLFAAGALLSCVEAEASLVSDEIKEQAAELRTVIERRES